MHPLLKSDQPFPIMAWIGPGIGDQGSVNVPISEKSMGDLADAGFNLSLSAIGESDPCRDLSFSPGQGRLFRFKREITPTQMEGV